MDWRIIYRFQLFDDGRNRCCTGRHFPMCTIISCFLRRYFSGHSCNRRAYFGYRLWLSTVCTLPRTKPCLGHPILRQVVSRTRHYIVGIQATFKYDRNATISPKRPAIAADQYGINYPPHLFVLLPMSVPFCYLRNENGHRVFSRCCFIGLIDVRQWPSK